MNVIIEDNINFYDLIYNDDTDNHNDIIQNNNEDIEKCLISNLPLDITYIELPCKHKFNYYYLYKEVYSQKKNYNPYKISIINFGDFNQNNFLCPYCRTNICELLPPAIDLKNVKSIVNINSQKNNYNKPKCIKLKCNIDSYDTTGIGFMTNVEKCNDNDNVYVTPYGHFCLMHYKSIKYVKNRKQKIIKKSIDYPIPELSKYERKYKLNELKDLCKNNNILDNGTKKELIIRLHTIDFNFVNTNISNL